MIHAPDPFGRRAMALSVLLHVAVLAGVLVGTMTRRPPPLEFLTYEIELVSPPPALRAEEPEMATEELVVERPEPEPAPPEPEEQREVVPVEQPEPDPETPPRPEPAAEVPPPPDEETTPAAAPDAPAEEEPAVSGEGINVRLEGVRRDYPQYYNNIIRQIHRCFRWRAGGTWETTVFFIIRQDGSASDIEFVTRSGNAAFDFEAMGAVDCAGQGRFGPLPDDLPFETLPVQFSFRPSDEPMSADLELPGNISAPIPATGRAAEVANHR